MSRYPFLINILLVAVAITLGSCGNKSAEVNKGHTEESAGHSEKTEHEELPDSIVELSQEQLKSAGIEYGSIVSKPLGSVIKASGIVAVPPGSSSTICASWGGIIRNISLQPGSSVTAGQVIATIENAEIIDLQQEYLDAMSKLEFAEAEYNRHQQLHSDDVYSTQNFQEVTSSYKSLKAKVNALSQKLQLIGLNPSKLNADNISKSINIKAGISGYVRTVNASNGKFVSSSDVLFEIANNNQMYLEITLFEKEMNNVKIGQQVEFFLNNETESHKARIYQVAQAVADDKSFKVYASVQLPCRNILPGMYVSTNISTSGTIVQAVPSESLVRFDNEYYLFAFEKSIQENGKPVSLLRMVKVEKGITSGGYTGVVLPAGFNPASKIVVKGAFQVMAAKKNSGEMSC